MVVVQALELGLLDRDQVAAELAIGEVGGFRRGAVAVGLREAVAGVVESGRETAAEAVEDDARDGLQLRDLVQAAEAGVRQAAAGLCLLAFRVVGFEGDTGAAYDRGGG
nr:hypothetical protein [Streptomyces sp. NEAU-YJ-81]